MQAWKYYFAFGLHAFQSGAEDSDKEIKDLKEQVLTMILILNKKTKGRVNYGKELLNQGIKYGRMG